MLAGSAKQTDNGGSDAASGDLPEAHSPDAGDARGEDGRREQQCKANPVRRRRGPGRLRLARRNRGFGSVLA
ncbi:hypothetical protein ABIF44_006748 [Bradyrhizobium japonicum]|nr:hypothetical protein [Bradyrhizobium japonicum]BAL13648.1 hypothetical protein BJ6T_84050 [Bradyrhizobium japonicum USDA 6]GEC48792.1 hypothetical protein BJA01nite_64340 [Bradyrhizobium japonicum]